jgi:hypothetical protein
MANSRSFSAARGPPGYSEVLSTMTTSELKTCRPSWRSSAMAAAGSVLPVTASEQRAQHDNAAYELKRPSDIAAKTVELARWIASDRASRGGAAQYLGSLGGEGW